jgi:hypothetical protein
MSEDELREFATNHGWRIIRRLGGRQIEFYNDASVRATVAGSGPGASVGHVRAIIVRYSNAGQRRQLAYQMARSKWKRRRFISLFLACSRSSAALSATLKAGSTASIIAGNHRGFAARSGISFA